MPKQMPQTTVIAAISDVHSSYKNLLGVWRMIEAETPADRIVCNCGDTVAYGDHPEECVEFFRSRPEIVCVGGNYDEHVADYPDRHIHYREKWGKKRPPKFAAIQKDSGIISEPSREWLLSLPHERCFDAGGHKVCLSHYAPGTRHEGLFVITRRKRLAEIARKLNSDLVIVGHTHMAFIRQAAGVVFINPGSIGRPWGAPSWARIVLEPGKPIRAEIKRWRG